jgi:hypothetical protein
MATMSFMAGTIRALRSLGNMPCWGDPNSAMFAGFRHVRGVPKLEALKEWKCGGPRWNLICGQTGYRSPARVRAECPSREIICSGIGVRSVHCNFSDFVHSVLADQQM